VLSDWSREILPEIGRDLGAGKPEEVVSGDSVEHGVTKGVENIFQHPNTPSDRIAGNHLPTEEADETELI